VNITVIEASDFLSFGHDGIKLDNLGDLATIVGPNSAGKTNVFRTLQFVVEAFWSRAPPVSIVRHHPTGGEPHIRVGVRFSSDEAGAIADWLLANSKMLMLSPQAGDPVIGGSIDLNEARRVSDDLLTRLKPTFKNLFSHELFFVVQGQGNPSYPYDTYVEVPLGPASLFVTRDYLLGLVRGAPGGFAAIELRRILVHGIDSRFPSVPAEPGQQRAPFSAAQVEEFARTLDLNWFLSQFTAHSPLPGVLQVNAWDLTSYDSQLRGQPSELVNFGRFLSERGWVQRAITLRDLLTLILMTSIVQLAGLRGGPSTTPLPEFHTIPTSLGVIDGSELPAVLYHLKNTPEVEDRRTFAALSQALRDLARVELNVVLETRSPESAAVLQRDAPVQYVQIPAIRFVVGGVEVPVDYAPAGMYDLLVFLFAILSRKESVLLLDEPALNLHPTMQRQLLAYLAEQSTTRSNQILLVTHSPFFVRPRAFSSIVRFALANGATRVLRPSLSNPSEGRQLVKGFELNPQLLEALFAERVVLAEGGDEAAGLSVWFDKLYPAVRMDDRSVQIIDVTGDGNFLNCAPVLDAWGIPFFIVADARARPIVARVGESRAYVYPQNDFWDILEAECEASLRGAQQRVGSRKRKAIAVVRDLAINSDPPPTVRAICERLKPFIEGREQAS